MNNKEATRLAHNAIAQEYYELYKDDKTLAPDTLVAIAKYVGKIL